MTEQDQHSTRTATWADVDVFVAYSLLRLRSDVFVVEQDCVYPDLDGRDLEPTTQHRWVADPDDPARVLAYLRVLLDGPRRRIGRVVTAPAARGRGLAARLVADVVVDLGTSGELVLDAQSHLAHWYARFGFVRDGDDFVEDGIPHTPMARPAG
ncbi:GNAT family N-acetyltransferase [Aquipuribacter sp. MA13-6]|uniref:GNAT family N-acetyltransferase n=1 Tax=unclassified Aquipuribacter TaxID=2635084 RepID=UPI003EF03CA7